MYKRQTYSDAIVYTCKRCGEQKKEQIVHMHNYQLVSETMATCISEGKRTYQCKMCIRDRPMDAPTTSSLRPDTPTSRSTAVLGWAPRRLMEPIL